MINKLDDTNFLNYLCIFDGLIILNNFTRLILNFITHE